MKKLSIDNKIDIVLCELIEHDELSPDSLPFFILAEHVCTKSGLTKRQLWDLLGGKLSYEYDAIEFLTENFYDTEFQIKINYSNFVHYLKDTNRISEDSESLDKDAVEEFKETRGRKEKVPWNDVHAYICKIIVDQGERAFASQDSLAQEVKDWCKEQYRGDISISAVKERLKPYWKVFGKSKNN